MSAFCCKLCCATAGAFLKAQARALLAPSLAAADSDDDDIVEAKPKKAAPAAKKPAPAAKKPVPAAGKPKPKRDIAFDDGGMGALLRCWVYH